MSCQPDIRSKWSLRYNYFDRILSKNCKYQETVESFQLHGNGKLARLKSMTIDKLLQVLIIESRLQERWISKASLDTLSDLDRVKLGDVCWIERAISFLWIIHIVRRHRSWLFKVEDRRLRLRRIISSTSVIVSLR